MAKALWGRKGLAGAALSGCTLHGRAAPAPAPAAFPALRARLSLASGPAAGPGSQRRTPVYRNGNLHDENNLGRILIFTALGRRLGKNRCIVNYWNF